MRTVTVAIFVQGDFENPQENLVFKTERVSRSLSAREYCIAYDIASEAMTKVSIVRLSWKDSVIVPSYILSKHVHCLCLASVGLQFKKGL